MTEIRCRFCKQIFRSLIIDPGQACQEVLMDLSKHAVLNHNPEAMQSMSNIQLLSLLICLYLPIVNLGTFENLYVGEGEVNNMENYQNMSHDKIRELLTAIHIQDPKPSILQ